MVDKTSFDIQKLNGLTEGAGGWEGEGGGRGPHPLRLRRPCIEFCALTISSVYML
jgi:hypothetical protein